MELRRNGFQKCTGTETVIHRHKYKAPRWKYTAVIVLKTTYHSVPQEKLMDILAKKLSKNMVEIIKTML